MKKFLICLIVSTFLVNTALADDLRLDKETKYQKKIMETGFRILNANKIDKRMTFCYSTEQKPTAKAYARTKKIVLNKGIIPYLEDENEIAGILSQKIADELTYHKGILRRSDMFVRSKTYEKKSDKIAVDLMVNAGYNPIALIVAENKLSYEPNWFDVFSKRTKGSKKLTNIYEYIYKEYPAYIAENDYGKNIYYQNFLLTSKDARKKIREKYAQNEVLPVNNKKQTPHKKQGAKKIKENEQ